jgi:MbtH protein
MGPDAMFPDAGECVQGVQVTFPCIVARICRLLSLDVPNADLSGVADVNPFDNVDGEFVVVVNAEEQHSLWPTFADVPAGWRVVAGPAPKQECLDHVARNWTDLRPLSIR